MSDDNSEIKSRAQKLLASKGKIADGINLDDYSNEVVEHKNYSSEKEIPEDIRSSMKSVGIEVDQEKTGLYLQNGNKANYCVSNHKGIELLPIQEAIKKYDGTDGKLNLKDYLWKAVAPDKDIFTAEAAIQEITDGYFIYARKGQKSVFPLQSCLFIDLPGFKQVVHNIIIAEEGSQLDLITGCTVHKGIKKALHLGVSEFFVKKDAIVSFTMVHNWKESTHVRPRTGIILEENAKFSNFYVVMSAVKSLQTNPQIYLRGKNSAYFGQTLIYGKKNSLFDTGATAFLQGEGSSAEIISRVIAVDGTYIKARGKIVGEAKNVTGHIDCSAILLSKDARVDSIPEIDAKNPDVTLTHEASVGKISSDHIEYLMSRGLTENEATELIIRGFLDADTSPLPPELAKETKRLIQVVADSEMG
jgi:Fe-S cluster assembly protein SufB